MSAGDQADITERPTLTLVADNDADPIVLTRGDWKALWVQFELVTRAQQNLGDQLGTVRSSVHEVRGDMSKALVAMSTVSAKLSLVKLTREVGVTAGALALIVLAGCGAVLTGRYMGWW